MEVFWEIQNVISVMEIDCVCDHEVLILLLRKNDLFQTYQGHVTYALENIGCLLNPHCIKDTSYLDDRHYKKQLDLQHGFFSISCIQFP